MQGIFRTVHEVKTRQGKTRCGETMEKNKQKKILSWHATIVAFQRCLELCCTKIGIQVNFKLSTRDAVNTATPPES